MPATFNGTPVLSIGEVSERSQQPPTAVRRIAKQLSCLCVADDCGRGYYAESDANRILEKLSEQAATQKAKDKAAEAERKRPKSLKELRTERNRILAKYPADFKPDPQWCRSTIDGGRLVELEKQIEAQLEKVQ